MLETILLKNFKGFKNLENLNIRPITILCGTNSCGKSSILQSILLLKQTLESQNPNQVLLLNGRFVHLGSLENVLYEKNEDNRLIFDFTFRLSKDDQFVSFRPNTAPLRVFLRNFYPKGAKRGGWTREGIVNLRIVLKAPKAKKRNKSYIKAVTVEQFSFGFETMNTGEDGSSKAFINIKLENDNLYTITWNNIGNRISRGDETSQGEIKSVKVEFTSLFSIGSVSIEGDIDIDRDRGIGLSDVSFALYEISNIFQIIFSSYSYIGPLREEPSRRYIYEDEIVEIGVKGENAAYIYLTDQDKPIENHYFYNPKNNSFESKKRVTLSAAVQEWLDLMNIREFKSEVVNEIVYLNLSSSSTPRTRVSIADVGFGVSQIFPIILEGLRMPKMNTLLLEQPEIHLHPNLQMQLSDYFIALAHSGKKVIVETHSDHIINRLIRRIIEDETGLLKEMIGIYFISTSDDGSICEEVHIDENFGVVNWPVDFFDQAAIEQEKIMRAGLKKRKNLRNKL